ncbi:MAG: hypothetical protein IPN70_04185 [Candidatus Moraniibacteriota bacterium]|nr:MAG: hypothetical protein IPN70_04185 [Candidatus Moranbacteria bacterium]
MSDQKKVIIFMGIALIFFGIGSFWFLSFPHKAQEPSSVKVKNNQTSITNFDECVLAGNPIMESYPRGCMTQDGRSFVEILTEEAQLPLVGNDRDEYGCIGSAGYTWCEEKQKCLRTWEEDCFDEAHK